MNVLGRDMYLDSRRIRLERGLKVLGLAKRAEYRQGIAEK